MKSIKGLSLAVLALTVGAPALWAAHRSQGALAQAATAVHADAPAPVGEAGETGNFIEDKLFKILLDTYERRDEHEFLKFYDFYLESFPNSAKKAQLAEYRQKFFYNEALDVYKLGGALVEVGYPEAKSWDEAAELFRQFKQRGMKFVQVKVMQKVGDPVFLFSKGGIKQGYFFPNPNGPVLDNLLDRLADLAHDNDLKLLASLPIRNFPALDRLPSLVLDQSFNPVSTDMKFNGHLDLMHPEALDFLLNLTEALTKTKVDGLVIENDFTYEPQEGFSEMARRRFKLDSGISLDLHSLVVSFPSKGDFGVVGQEEYQTYLLWRSRQIKQLLWELVEKTKKMRAEFLVGIEVTPEMLDSNPLASMYWYSTSLDLLWDLPVDFRIFCWAKRGHPGESGTKDYFSAVDRYTQRLSPGSQSFLKVPLNDQTQNVILLNDRIRRNLGWMEDHDGLLHAIGPLDRRYNWNFLQHKVVEKLEVEEVK
ncbi:MAG: hypothetical protein A2600_03435 [Candidatus Lambdaproteobacteria bacterium RIFOXYD1_FULL_56_27]|uniref:GH10 domain-containing protein n=1 Tax=Candidatus Lambdaproteobacteria bacterium RIFOXYD2_FULL_56_26 TaxID=1817773 RepID=A0A1F6H395_9PROT|nr:MAG: hypothetical protein A2426_11495 [Candidatus Lambdaproteobacteria bacterium RIFOXYC1_FULL_56_13]OGH04822.1 MAG: hypothetical protein A2557_07500 [Candidatus Lambdaproteobacteria bacterium RIFOXYD2_FULL_56_26]OGH09287.1 MAG: hypothetical protein A2600_03435 [Candidatus Lambdaproteobacteria bacterium RIFOXYD1_FULL_56_27]